MGKRKITVTVDEELVNAVQGGSESLSSVVNTALAGEVDRRARAATLRRLLASWDDAHGPVDDAAADGARQAFDDLDGLDADVAQSSPGAA